MNGKTTHTHYTLHISCLKNQNTFLLTCDTVVFLKPLGTGGASTGDGVLHLLQCAVSPLNVTTHHRAPNTASLCFKPEKHC